MSKEKDPGFSLDTLIGGRVSDPASEEGDYNSVEERDEVTLPERSGGEARSQAGGINEAKLLKLGSERAAAKRSFTICRKALAKVCVNPDGYTQKEVDQIYGKVMVAFEKVHVAHSKYLTQKTMFPEKPPTSEDWVYCREGDQELEILQERLKGLRFKQDKEKKATPGSSGLGDSDRMQTRTASQRRENSQEVIERLYRLEISTDEEDPEEVIFPHRGPKVSKENNLWLPVPAKEVDEDKALFIQCLGASVRADSQVPKFGGDLREWPEFELAWRDFDEKLAAMSKSFFFRLTQLKTVLSGDALRLIQNLPPRDSSYELALQLLAKTYSNKQYVTDRVIQDIEDLCEMGGNGRDFLMKVTGIQQSLIALGMMDDSSDMAVITQKIIRKSHARVQRKVAILQMELDERDSGKRVNFDQVMRLIEQDVKVGMALQKTGGTKEKRYQGGKDHPKATVLAQSAKKAEKQEPDKEEVAQEMLKKIFTSQMAAESAQMTGEKKKFVPRYPCTICEKTGHLPLSCFEIKKKTLKEFGDLVVAKRLCKVCLTPKHNARDCKHREKDKFKCRECGRPGHCTALHGYNPAASRTNTITTEAIVSRLVEVETKSGRMTVDPILDVVKCFLMIKDSDGNVIVEKKVFSFNDSGSQVTLLKRSLADQLKLDGVRENMTITTLHGTETIESKRVEFFLQDLERKYPPIRITGLTHEDPCKGGLHFDIEAQDWEAVKNFRLSFDPTKELVRDIEVLLGQPYVAMIDRGKVGEAPSGFPFIKESTLGRFLAGGLPTRLIK